MLHHSGQAWPSVQKAILWSAQQSTAACEVGQSSNGLTETLWCPCFLSRDLMGLPAATQWLGSLSRDVMDIQSQHIATSATSPSAKQFCSWNCSRHPCSCREGKINEAVRFAQETLSPLRGIMAHRSKEYDAMLHDTVALIAYEQPAVRLSLSQHITNLRYTFQLLCYY